MGCLWLIQHDYKNIYHVNNIDETITRFRLQSYRQSHGLIFLQGDNFRFPVVSLDSMENLSIEISNEGHHTERLNLTYLSDSCTTPIESDASAVTVSASSFSRC